MKQLRFRYASTGEIATPFPIRNRSYKPSESITATLCTLFPHRAGYFMDREPDTLVITSVPASPFGPDPFTLREFLFENIEAACSTIHKQYPELQIRLHNESRMEKIENLNEPAASDAKKEVLLSLEEFHALYRAVSNKEKVSALLCSIFLDPDNVFTLFVPGGTTLKKMFTKVEPVSNHLEKHPTSKPYHPISGQEFELNEKVGFRTDLISFSKAGYVLSPGAGPIFGFPYWNRTLGMRPGKIISGEPQPCNNCLACSRFCPVDILPSHLYHNIDHDNLDEAERLGLNLCIECGICQFVCPASLPLYSTISSALHEEGGSE